jgi:hypothetical protein
MITETVKMAKLRPTTGIGLCIMKTVFYTCRVVDSISAVFLSHVARWLVDWWLSSSETDSNGNQRGLEQIPNYCLQGVELNPILCIH